MRKKACDISGRIPVPKPIVLYALLSLCDLGFTLAAFMLGASEANPALAWFASYGLFDFVKITTTLLVCCVAFRLWHVRFVRRLMTISNALMLGVILYHSWLWIRYSK